jgi:hypothetical protein
MLDFGTYPTPVEHIAELSSTSTSLWVKRDDLTSPLYGGSKVRKLERHVLFWHTLSSAPLGPLLVNAPSEQQLDVALRRLAH